MPSDCTCASTDWSRWSSVPRLAACGTELRFVRASPVDWQASANTAIVDVSIGVGDSDDRCRTSLDGSVSMPRLWLRSCLLRDERLD